MKDFVVSLGPGDHLHEENGKRAVPHELSAVTHRPVFVFG